MLLWTCVSGMSMVTFPPAMLPTADKHNVSWMKEGLVMHLQVYNYFRSGWLRVVTSGCLISQKKIKSEKHCDTKHKSYDFSFTDHSINADALLIVPNHFQTFQLLKHNKWRIFIIITNVSVLFIQILLISQQEEFKFLQNFIVNCS